MEAVQTETFMGEGFPTRECGQGKIGLSGLSARMVHGEVKAQCTWQRSWKGKARA